MQNEIIGKIILGKIVPIILQVYAQFGNVILILCVLLRARSVSRMMNKLYVIGMKQKEVIERCFLHETGTYISSITEEDLHALTNKSRSVKRHNNVELFGLKKVKMSHLDAAKELTDEEQEQKRENMAGIQAYPRHTLLFAIICCVANLIFDNSVLGYLAFDVCNIFRHHIMGCT